MPRCCRIALALACAALPRAWAQDRTIAGTTPSPAPTVGVPVTDHTPPTGLAVTDNDTPVVTSALPDRAST